MNNDFSREMQRRFSSRIPSFVHALSRFKSTGSSVTSALMRSQASNGKEQTDELVTTRLNREFFPYRRFLSLYIQTGGINGRMLRTSSVSWEFFTQLRCQLVSEGDAEWRLAKSRIAQGTDASPRWMQLRMLISRSGCWPTAEREKEKSVRWSLWSTDLAHVKQDLGWKCSHRFDFVRRLYRCIWIRWCVHTIQW